MAMTMAMSVALTMASLSGTTRQGWMRNRRARLTLPTSIVTAARPFGRPFAASLALADEPGLWGERPPRFGSGLTGALSPRRPAVTLGVAPPIARAVSVAVHGQGRIRAASNVAFATITRADCRALA